MLNPSNAYINSCYNDAVVFNSKSTVFNSKMVITKQQNLNDLLDGSMLACTAENAIVLIMDILKDPDLCTPAIRAISPRALADLVVALPKALDKEVRFLKNS